MAPTSSLNYHGRLTDDLRANICDLLRQSLRDNLDGIKQISKLVLYALELLDNAQRYSTVNDVRFECEAKNGELTLSVINKASLEDANRLMETVNSLRNKSSDEINVIYKKSLSNNQFGSKGGAGLGFLQILRNGSNELNVHVEQLSGDIHLCKSVLVAKITINSELFPSSAI
ncbi:MAG: DUF6272 family protein [Flavobacteriales bacterium]|nr:DUF6272 family protein [Flavobacteriales bacterium]